MIKDLIVEVEDASFLSVNDQQAFAMIRRIGFGASDSSILLGVNPFPDGTLSELITTKRSKVITAKEKAIGEMLSVRKGSDLEPIIMQKFERRFNITEDRLTKPKAMYRIPNTHLTVNFDGVLQLPPIEVPVECKYVSTAGHKYYNLGRAIAGEHLPMGGDLQYLGDEVSTVYIAKRAEECGIPVYYYTQVQQQLLALGAPFGYLAALFDKDWELRTFKIIADPKVQHKLIEAAASAWEKI